MTNADNFDNNKSANSEHEQADISLFNKEDDLKNETAENSDPDLSIFDIKDRAKKGKDKEKDKETRKKHKKDKPLVDKRNKSLKKISVSSALLFIALVITFNFVLDSFLGDKLRWDWSQTSMLTIGEVTENILASLDKDVRIIGLYEKGNRPIIESDSLEIILEKYVEKSKGRVTVEYIDPVKNPSILREVDPEEMEKPESNDIVVFCEETKKIKVLGVYDLLKVGYDQSYNQTLEGVTAEEALSGAILYVTSENTPVVYMTKGHSEDDYKQTYTVMESLITNNNFQIKDLDMLVENQIPKDASLVFMLNPHTDININEKKVLEDYLKTGGSLLVMTEFNSQTFENLNSLLNIYNIEISNNRVRETDQDRRPYPDDSYMFLADTLVGPLAEEAVNRGTLLMNSRAINEVKNAKEWISLDNLIVTGDKAVLEPLGVAEEAGQPGKVTLGIASENSGYMDGETVTEPARVMVFGSVQFMSDLYLRVFGSQTYNAYAFYAGLSWLVDVESQNLMIAPKKLPSYILGAGSSTAYWIAGIVTAILIPILLLIMAIVVYRRRKNL